MRTSRVVLSTLAWATVLLVGATGCGNRSNRSQGSGSGGGGGRVRHFEPYQFEASGLFLGLVQGHGQLHGRHRIAEGAAVAGVGDPVGVVQLVALVHPGQGRRVGKLPEHAAVPLGGQRSCDQKSERGDPSPD